MSALPLCVCVFLCIGCVSSWPVPPERLSSVLAVKKLRAPGCEVTQREGITAVLWFCQCCSAERVMLKKESRRVVPSLKDSR